MHSKTIPIGATISYGSFVLNPAFKELLDRFTQMEVSINGCKQRTARGINPNYAIGQYIMCGAGYALKDVAVFHIMRTNPEVFRRLGRSWDDDENSYCHVLFLS